MLFVWLVVALKANMAERASQKGAGGGGLLLFSGLERSWRGLGGVLGLLGAQELILILFFVNLFIDVGRSLEDFG